MKNNVLFIILVLILFSFYSCNNKHIDTNKISKRDSIALSEKNQDSLAFELCQIYGLDQGLRRSKGFSGKMKLIQKIDTFNFERIVNFVKTNGIPSEKLVGGKNFSQECVEGALGAVLLHNPHMLVNEKKHLNIFLEEVNKGNLKMETLITVLDKYYWVKRDEFGNRKLLYGSQFGKPCKKFRRESDSVRAAIGLPPLPDSSFVDCKNQ